VLLISVSLLIAAGASSFGLIQMNQKIKKEKCSTARVHYMGTLFFLPTAPNVRVKPG
jgi:hypothetical protein